MKIIRNLFASLSVLFFMSAIFFVSCESPSTVAEKTTEGLEDLGEDIADTFRTDQQELKWV